MPLYHKHDSDEYAADKIKKCIDKASEVIDVMFNVRILGGEPFLNMDLGEIIEYCLSTLNIDTVHIVTNGTVIPDRNNECLMNALRKERVIVYISNYGKILSRRIDELIKLFTEEEIRYEYGLKPDDVWFDLGKVKDRKDSMETKKKKFRACGLACHTYIKGKAYYCPRSAFGEDLGYFDFEEDHVDFVNNQMTREDKKKKYVKLLYEKEYLDACSFCAGISKKIQPAIQCKK